MHGQPALRLLSRELACAVLVLLLASASLLAQRKARPSLAAKYVPVAAYDPRRDAAKDIQHAIREAERTRKHILLEVGGEWCSWCHTLDKFFESNQDLLKLREANFITLKINFSRENENKEVLSAYPPINGYPHIFFLDSHGKLLQSQDTSVLEDGKGYNLERLTVALKNWSPMR